jgi:hypothetical protein
MLPHISYEFKKERSVTVFGVIMSVVTVNIFVVLMHAVKCLLFAMYGPSRMQMRAVQCLLCTVAELNGPVHLIGVDD